MKNKKKLFILFFILTLGIFSHQNLVFAKDYKYEFEVTRLGGKNRYETNANILKYGFFSPYLITVVNGQDSFADAIVAAPLAKRYLSSMALVQKDRIPTPVKNQLSKMDVREAIIIGGEGVVSKKVENELKSMGIKIRERIGGKNRFETNVNIGRRIISMSYAALLVENNDWRNALAATPVAGVQQIPIYYSNGKTAPKELLELNKTYHYNPHAIGELSNTNIDYVAAGMSKFHILTKGYDKIETNIQLYESFKDTISVEYLYLIDSKAYADGLSIAPVAGSRFGFIAFIDDNNLRRWQQFFSKYGIDVKKIFVIGNGVSDKNLKEIKDSIQISKNKKKIADQKAKEEEERWYREQDMINIPYKPSPEEQEEIDHYYELAKYGLQEPEARKIIYECTGVEVSGSIEMDAIESFIIDTGENIVGHRIFWMPEGDTDFLVDIETEKFYKKIKEDKDGNGIYTLIKSLK